MSKVAIANRIAVAQLSYTHALERAQANPTEANLIDCDAAAITLHLALVTA